MGKPEYHKNTGEKNGRAKLKSSEVNAIRDLYREGFSLRTLAGLCGLAITTIRHVTSGERYKDAYEGEGSIVRSHQEATPRGTKVGVAKLDPDKVRDVRRRAAAGESMASIARFFGVCDRTIRQVIDRESWRHVP